MRWLNKRSLTFRLTMLFAAASAAVWLALGLLIGQLVDRHFEELDIELLTGKLELVRDGLRIARSPHDLDVFARHLDDGLVEHSGIALAIRGLEGKPIVTVGDADFPDSMFAREEAIDEAGATLWTTHDGRLFRGIAGEAVVGIQGSPRAMVAVAIDMSSHKHFMASFQNTLWMVVLLAAIANGILGWAAVRHGLSPMRLIKQRASEITANKLDRRLELDAVPAELGDLVEALNAMLARLEESFRRLSDFSSDIAHELRTPVCNMLTQTQVMLSKGRSADEYRETLYSNAEEFERLSRMISGMLFLAKADHGLVLPHREEVDLAAEVQNLFSFFEVLAEGNGVHLSLDGEGSVAGDRMLLRRALSNLLSNAIRHTPEGGAVRVLIEPGAEGDELLVRIENTGTPIPAEHIPRLFDRFYRANASRRASSEGVGLGLAITKSIVGLHRGAIGVVCGHDTTSFEMRLPKTASI